MVIALILQIMFLIDPLTICFKQNAKRTLWYLLSPALCIAIAALSASFGSPTYTSEFVIFHLMHSFTFNISQYRLMLANMTKTEFNPVGLENIFQCIPLFVNLTCSNKLERVALEPLANKICLAFMFVLFYSHIAMLAQQFLARHP